ncbi:MAG: DUF4167 domain-containing protein [Paracoccaceae bacterium]|nr:DUF4167 domain-containing protein [Paracoccaceae bacterium]
MRSSKSRSRSKSNRNRPSGNIVNRVFDSNGPEGKVRGTPQQVIDKYNQLARDAQLSGDRVALENFQQHAEHYVRMLNEAQREQREAQERREQQDRDRREQQQQHGQGQPPGGEDRSDQPQPDAAEAAPAEVIDASGGEDEGSTLVETPEMKPQRARRPRRQREASQTEGEASGNQEAAE